MSNEVATTNAVSNELLMEYLKTLNSGFNNSQIAQFCAVAQAFGLNPFKREIYAVPYKDKDGNVTMSIVTGYESYIKRAEMCPAYDGFEVKIDGKFSWQSVTKKGKNGSTYTVQILAPEGEVSCTCTVYRKDRSHPFSETVYFDEYVQNNSMWQTKPRTMLKKVAIVSAFRKAFPLDFGGMPYTNDELPDKMTQPQMTECEVVHEDVAPSEEPTKAVTHAETDEISKEKLAGFEDWSKTQQYRVGLDAFSKVMEQFGGKSQVTASKKVMTEFTKQIMALPDYKVQNVNTEDDNNMF